MIKREALELFMSSCQMQINECRSFEEQDNLMKNFLKRLLDAGKITPEQYEKWV